VDAVVRDHALRLADPTGAFAAVRALRGGDAVAAAWQARAIALTSYHRLLAEQRNPASVLATLLHEHHVRAFGLYPDHETTVGRLARASRFCAERVVHRELAGGIAPVVQRAQCGEPGGVLRVVDHGVLATRERPRLARASSASHARDTATP